MNLEQLDGFFAALICGPVKGFSIFDHASLERHCRDVAFG
jgi:hypothetical protein